MTNSNYTESEIKAANEIAAYGIACNIVDQEFFRNEIAVNVELETIEELHCEYQSIAGEDQIWVTLPDDVEWYLPQRVCHTVTDNNGHEVAITAKRTGCKIDDNGELVVFYDVAITDED